MNLSSGQRVASIAAGVMLVQLGARMPRTRTVSRAVGLGFVARGASGYCPVVAATRTEQSLSDTQAALSGPNGVHVREAITIARPRAELYRVWRDLEGLPRLLQHIRRVNQIGSLRSHWTIVGERGVPLAWDAELVNDIENELVAWRSVRSRVVMHAGSVVFREVPAGTEVLVHMQYRPVAGALGSWAARLLGHHPHVHVREDLRHMKQLLETGEIATVQGQPSGRVEGSRRRRVREVVAS